MDMDTLREGLHVSISQVKMYLRCPRQFFFRYVDGAQPEGTSASLLFGKAFHASLAALYVTIKDTRELPDVATLVEVFTDSWETENARTVVEDAGKLGNPVTKAGKMLRVWLAMMKLRALPEVVEVEKAFSIPLMDHVTGHALEERLVGAFDLVIVEHGRTVVVEHKTAARRYGADVLLNDLQLTGYRLAARELGIGADVGLRMQVFTKGNTPGMQVEDVRRTDADERNLLRTIHGVLKAVDAGVFHPTPGWHCAGCPYRLQCRGMP